MKAQVQLVLMILLLAGESGCSWRVPLASTKVAVPESRSYMLLHDRPLEVRFAKADPLTPVDILVLYSTGDGGWWGIDDQMFHWISSWGYPVAGISSRAYLKNLGHTYDTDSTTPRRLVRDFTNIIRFSESHLGLPESTRVVLVGNSRGAGLSVVAAGQGQLMPRLAGLIAVALTKEEEHVFHFRRLRRRESGKPPERERVEIKTYEYLPRLANFPVSVIQSEHDGYLPAEAARALFGPDTELHKLHAIDASNHSFHGGRQDLFRQLEESLRWISDLAPAIPSSTSR